MLLEVSKPVFECDSTFHLLILKGFRQHQATKLASASEGSTSGKQANAKLFLDLCQYQIQHTFYNMHAKKQHSKTLLCRMNSLSNLQHALAKLAFNTGLCVMDCLIAISGSLLAMHVRDC